MTEVTQDRSAVLRERLRSRIEALGRNPRAVSLEAGLSPDALRMILNGRSKAPKADTLAAVAKVLDCDLDYLLGTTNNPRAAEVGESEFLELSRYPDPARLILLSDLLGKAVQAPLREAIRKRQLESTMRVPPHLEGTARVAELLGVIEPRDMERMVALWQLAKLAVYAKDEEYLSTDDAQPLLRRIVDATGEEPQDYNERMDYRAALANDVDLWVHSEVARLSAPRLRGNVDFRIGVLERLIAALQKQEAEQSETATAENSPEAE